jgi:DNA-binding winged helix-turn-helix (wHTH) protein/TolB-like protein/Tfp pilus assembly protein PilF
MQIQIKRVYEFGQFRLDAQEGVLLKDDRSVPLTPKAFDLLVLLVENRGHLVLKEEIMSRLWPESFVEEVNVNRNISTLRRALADSPTDPAYIETVPKRGYRFVAAAVEVPADEAGLILERRTSAEIITEEEEITETGGPGTDEVFEPATLPISMAARTGLISRLRQHAGLLSAAIMLALFAAAVYLSVGQLGRAATTARVKSIAVLPFKDMGATGDEHVGLGLADVLITRLGNLKAVTVRPTSAVLKFEGQEQESTAAGKLLGVDAVLEGSIYQSHDQIRVTARLVRVSDQSPIWSGQFDDKAKDMLVVQNAIAGQVAEALALNLSAGEKAALARPAGENADAYQLYVKGRYYWNKRSWQGMVQAGYFFRRAIERDPNFALAYLGLADQLATEPGNPEANVALDKALALDPNLGEAYATMGFIQMFHQWDWPKAEESFKRAIELKPGYGTAHQWYATLLAITGRADDAKQEMRRALEIDPMSANFLADLGQMHYFAREYEEAEAYCRKALEIAPDFIFAHEYLTNIYMRTGRAADAFDEWRQRDRSNTFVAPANASLPNEARVRAQYLQSGMNGFLRQRIKDHVHTSDPNFFYEVARLYALLGEREPALAGLERSYESKGFLLPFVSADPLFDDLRAEPRYRAILQKMKLSP